MEENFLFSYGGEYTKITVQELRREFNPSKPRLSVGALRGKARNKCTITMTEINQALVGLS